MVEATRAEPAAGASVEPVGRWLRQILGLPRRALEGAAAKTEHIEVAAYRGLVSKATLMGHKEVARLLRQILNQEEDAVQELEAAAKQLARQTIKQTAAA